MGGVGRGRYGAPVRGAADNLIEFGGAALIMGLIFRSIVRAGPPPDRSRKINFWFQPGWRDRVEWDSRYGPYIARLGIPLGAVVAVTGVILRLAS
jgi:hypothetical protein